LLSAIAPALALYTPSRTDAQSTPRQAAPPPKAAIILATTTSTQDSGLLDVLVPRFERESGITVKVIAVGW
jgi:tungstate transport system substrate-binding protein